MTHSQTVLFLTGSLRRPSHSCGLCHSVATTLGNFGMTVTMFDQRDVTLPLHDSVWHKAPEQNPDPGVRKLVQLAEQADAFVLASPIYHNGPSGVLKNALDHLAIEHFAYKPIGLISHGGNRTSQAVDQMRIWGRGLLGHAIATQICTQNSDFEPHDTDDPRISNPDISARIERFCRELSVMAKTLAIARTALIE
ncbi:NAD(P)H-dependent oxidoreductase (plasmid) [Rhizobium lusitanum]|uniref:NADPH-dependent FMN reductase n=1 Tax=Rhizobium lusitanum TaxID=293958 RepID=UPI0016080516|nr:NADPH-dependent FMN reductase [Rhizobium lusitanum]QND45962.1 NAD(P)H-dependent oxidoreductase [Rhizobium lusitanum]